MKIGKSLLPLLLLSLVIVGCKNTNDKKKSEDEISKRQERLISLNGAVTEIVFALGRGNDLVGRDVTSTYPQEAKDSVKDLGHVRSLNMESIMALKPTMILGSEKDMSDELEKSLEESGPKFKLFKQDFSVEGTKALIKEVADYIGSENTEAMMQKIDADLEGIKSFDKKPKVLFVYARGAGTMMVAGNDTPMKSMIELAGGENAIDAFDDFKPLTEEALLKSDPDVILLFDSGLESLGGKEGFIKEVSALSETKAGKNKAVITMDGSLLSEFGPRVGEAAFELNQLLAPYAE